MIYSLKGGILGIVAGLLALPASASAAQIFTQIYFATDGGFMDGYTFSETGDYRVSILGAAGGGAFGGFGASLIADFTLTAGTRFDILIGKSGGRRSGFEANRGGGGTFVIVDGRAFVVAGGGGGSGQGGNGDANSGESGTSGSAGGGNGPVGGVEGGGRGGQGGQGGNAPVDRGGQGGGGYLSGGSPSGGASYQNVINSRRGDVASLTTGGQALAGGGGGGGGGSFVDSAGRLIFDPAFEIGRPMSEDGGLAIWRISSTVPPAAVPEPATWALMIIGFGAVGTAMRRGHTMRRRETMLTLGRNGAR